MSDGRGRSSRQAPPIPSIDRDLYVPRDDTYGEREEFNTRRPSSRGRTVRAVVLTAVVVLALVAAALGYAYYAGRLRFSMADANAPEANNDAAAAVVIFSGNADQFTATAGNLVQQDPSDASVVWLRSSLTEAKSGGSTDGVSVAIPSRLTNGWLGKSVRVTVSATAGSQKNPAPFAVAYSTNGTGNSGWIVFNPTSQFTDYSFVYQIPPGTAGAAHYVGIWSDISGRSGALAVRKITVELAK